MRSVRRCAGVLLAAVFLSCGREDPDPASASHREPRAIGESAWERVELTPCPAHLEMPGAPRTAVDRVESPNPEEPDIETHMRLLQSSPATWPGFTASCTEWPPGVLPADDDAVYDGLRRRARVTSDGLGGGIVDERTRAIELHGVKRLEATLRFANQGVATKRFYRVGERTYQMGIVAGPGENLTKADAERFWGSLRW